MIFFAFIHEMGHLVTGLLLGLRPKELRIMPFGLSILFIDNYDNKKKSLLKKFLIASAGPVTNIVILFIVFFLNINFQIKDIIIYSNMLIAIFNLLPIYPMDGGRILKSILKIKKDTYTVEKIVNKVSNVTIIILTILSSILILYYKNLVIFLVILYLWTIVIKENKRYNFKKRIYNTIKTIDF